MKYFKNVSIIVAKSENNVIGANNELLWHIPEDLKLFKLLTKDNYIIMGRKTFESLPKVLDDRIHIVLTRDTEYTINNPNVIIFHDIDTILNFIENKPNELFYIIGGGEIYKLFLPYVYELNISVVNGNFDGDTYFPDINETIWQPYYKQKYENFVFHRFKRVESDF